MRAFLLALLICGFLPAIAQARAQRCEGPVAVCLDTRQGVALIRDSKPVSVYVDADGLAPVKRVAGDFADDLGKVSGTPAKVVHDLTGLTGDVVVIAQSGHSALVDEWIKSGRLQAEDISGKWEYYRQAVVDRPAPGIGQALVILGSDPRGVVYGTYDISEKIGVSPWYWWADVPIKPQTNITVTPGERHDAPAVKYRGFFINDEEPAFGGWAREKFGGINHQLYAKVFELDLRLKGNYLWPAMWGKAIADDDPETLKTANDYGIVLGTSHHEPMTRAQEEWHRHTDQGVTGGKWDYTKNAENLRAFWRGGIERSLGHEMVVTVGMRGDGDEPMSEGTATNLLETIVADQRQIIADVTGKPPEQTPQVWALYKEVQDYYDGGMKVPDDVTLLFSDDNWGQIRRLPDPKAPPRAGGYGVYYHFDYVGGPRNYKWLNTNQIEKTWQQMNLAYDSGADRLWIVNVGDIKPMEYPLSFFLDMAWNPKAMSPEALKAYPAKWAGQQFGSEAADKVGQILTRYSQYAARRKPELIDEHSFATTKDNGASEFNSLSAQLLMLNTQSQFVRKNFAPEYGPAWTELIGYPVAALSNLYRLYDMVGENRIRAAANETYANTFADWAQQAFEADTKLSAGYNALNGGKWNHMMDQTHIGYTAWQQPDVQVMPEVRRVTHGIDVSLDPVPPVEAMLNLSGRFSDTDGYIAIEAEHFSRKIDSQAVRWQVIPDLGRTLSSVISMPQTAAPTTDSSVWLEYDVQTVKAADAILQIYLAPTLDTSGKGGLRIAVSIDDRPPQTLSFDLKPDTPDWNAAVKDNIVILSVRFPGLNAGPHTIKVFRIDGNVVLERLVLDTGGLKPSYLGPPESSDRH